MSVILNKEDFRKVPSNVWAIYMLQFSDGSIYIGKTTCLRQRILQHLSGIKRKPEGTFYNAVKGEYIENIRFIRYFGCRRNLEKEEKRVIYLYRNHDKLVNIDK